jgi:CopG family nickel-responsive transcriptional regulator
MDSIKQDSLIKQRFSFTLSPEIIKKIDAFAINLEMNRSQIVREALTQWLADHALTEDIQGEGVSLASYLYQHHETRVVQELMKIQHDFDQIIISTTHVHLTHDKCYETILCRGDLKVIKNMTNQIRSVNGINSFSVKYAFE